MMDINMIQFEYLRKFADTLYAFSKNNYLCDVNIVTTDNQCFTAHSLVLSAVSPQLKSVFEKYDPGQNKTFNNTFRLVADDCTPQCLEYVLQYIYTGHIDILPEQQRGVQNPMIYKKSSGPISKVELTKAAKKFGVGDHFVNALKLEFNKSLKRFLKSKKLKNANIVQLLSESFEPLIYKDIDDDNDDDDFDDKKDTDEDDEDDIKVESFDVTSGLNENYYNYNSINNCENINYDNKANDISANDDIFKEEICKVDNNSNDVNVMEEDDVNDTSNIYALSDSESLVDGKNEVSNEKHLKKNSFRKNYNDGGNDDDDDDGGDVDYTLNLTIDDDNDDDDYEMETSKSKSKNRIKNINSKVKKLFDKEITPKVKKMRNVKSKKHEIDDNIVCSLESILMNRKKTVPKRFSRKSKLILTFNSNTDKPELQPPSSPIEFNANDMDGSVNEDQSDLQETLICDVCGMSLASKEDYMSHRQEHASKRYTCDTCGKTFSRRYAMVEHKRMHNGERPFQCDRCGKRFTFACDLSKHRKSLHGTMKPYCCNDCGKEMSTGREVADHRRLHEGGNKCPVCGKTFTRLHNMKEHLKGVHGGFKPFSCNECDKSFVYSGSLRTHKLQHKNSTTASTSTSALVDITVTSVVTFTTSASPTPTTSSTSTVLKPIPCEPCGLKFGRQLDLIIHNKVHHAFNNNDPTTTMTTSASSSILLNKLKLPDKQVNSTGNILNSSKINYKIVRLPTNIKMTNESPKLNIPTNPIISSVESLKSVPAAQMPMFIMLNPNPLSTNTKNTISSSYLNMVSPTMSVNNTVNNSNIGVGGESDPLQEISFSDLF